MPAARDIKRALARINAAIPVQKKLAADHRNIRLGLERIERIVPKAQPWTGVHVGGTNGKGSICALLAAMFKQAGISHGTYTSPAIPERHHGITINGLYINKRMYEMELKHVQQAYGKLAARWTFQTGEDPGELTPFEVETATAFRVFDKMHVDYGIVEVGMGGATDATNVMRQKGVTVISKIGLDHQEYLGNTVEEIAKVKAGIMRPGVPCVVDYTNEAPVLDILRKHAEEVGTQVTLSRKAEPLLASLDTERFQLEQYEQQNLLCASLAFKSLFPDLTIDVNRLLATKPYLPGRKELVHVTNLTHNVREEPVFVDGAHNMLGVTNLADFVDSKLREGDTPVTWIMGLSASKSKPFAQLLETLIRPQDNFAFVEYIRGPNDPEAVPAELGRDIGRAIVAKDDQVYEGAPSITSSMQWASKKAAGGPIIVTGSLYLIRQFYSLDGVERHRKMKTHRPGLSQLWYYTRLAQERTLTPEEEREFKQARRHWHQNPSRREKLREIEDDRTKASSMPSEDLKALQAEASYHRNQAEGYAKGINSLKNDLLQPNRVTGVETGIEELQKRRKFHEAQAHAAMTKVRGRAADPNKKYMSYKQIFGITPKNKLSKKTVVRSPSLDKAAPAPASEESSGGPKDK